MENSKIEWTKHTFNPWIGCAQISPACDHCYAAALSARTFKVKWGAGEQRKRTSAEYWKQPLKWDAEAAKAGDRVRIFAASLADVFDNEVPVQWRVDLFELIAKTRNLDWMLLTKRVGNVKKQIEEAASYLRWADSWHDGVPPPNVHLGATICNQAEADRDVPKLLATPAAKRFLSIEPMLGAIKLTSAGHIPPDEYGPDREGYMVGPDDKKSTLYPTRAEALRRSGLDLVIAGGESGPYARPSHPDWFRALRDQCAMAGVPFMFKQWGEWLPARKVGNDFEFCDQNITPHSGWLDKPMHDFGDGYVAFKVGKKAAGRLLDGVEHNGRIACELKCLTEAATV